MARTSSPPRTPRRAWPLIVAAVTLGGMVLAVPAFPSTASTASTATETPLSQTGWVASSTTSSASGDAPQNAIRATPRSSSPTRPRPRDVLAGHQRHRRGGEPGQRRAKRRGQRLLDSR